MITVSGKQTKLSEEIVRWTFELACQNNKMRYVAFTNPTAGPWKRVLGQVSEGAYEIHTFGKEESRPDVIVVCDTLRAIYVLEAKDGRVKLDSDTINKTYLLSETFKERFAKFTGNEKWIIRANYNVITGFLFGSSAERADDEANQFLLKCSTESKRKSLPYVCITVDTGKTLKLQEYGEKQLYLFT
ncbi:MAG: hypothetical protein NVS3B3_17360 [Aquirhabdus sp.]